MKRFVQLTFVACLALASLAASFPYVTLNNKTNRLSDNGSALTFNGGMYQPASANLTNWSSLSTNSIGTGSVTTNAPNIAAGSIAAFVSSNVLAAATSAQLQSALGILNITLTHAGTVTLTNNALLTQADLVLTGAVTFATSGLTLGNSYTVYGRNTQASNCTPTLPSWRWMTGIPATITALKEWTLHIEARGTVDTNVWAWYQEAP